MAAREPQDRKPPAKRSARKATQRKPTAAELAAAEADDAERLQVEAEALDADAWQTIPLGESGKQVRVMRFADWPRSVYRRLNMGDFEAIGEIVHPDDAAVWQAWDSTIGELAEVGLLLAAEGAQDVGESVASKLSSRSMRRR